MSAEPHDHWEAVYTAKAEDEVSWFQPAPEPSPSLIVKATAERSARILDVGGDASRLVDALLDEGFQSVGVLDVAESGLGGARRRLGPRASQVEWIVADATPWRPPQA